MKKVIVLVLLFLSPLTIVQADTDSDKCSEYSAYQAGIEDGKAKNQLHDDYSVDCEQNADQLSQRYLQGYENGIAAVESNKAEKELAQLETGKTGCVSAFGRTECPQTADETCVKNATGDIRCGHGCHLLDDDIECDNS